MANRLLANNCYKPCSGSEVAKIIKKGMESEYEPLTEKQYYALRRFLGNGGILGNLDMDFQLYSWEEEKPKGKSCWWRLTFPLFFLFGIIQFGIIEPCHWILTGKWSFDSSSGWYTKFAAAWYRNLFERGI